LNRRRQTGTPADIRVIMSDVSAQGDSQTVTVFRDVTEMGQAAWVVLNSACGRYAAKDVLLHDIGTRAVFETEMVQVYVRTAEGGDLEKKIGVVAPQPGSLAKALAFGVVRMSLARMVIEVAPEEFPHPFFVHTFHPIDSYKAGKTPWYELWGCDGKPLGSRVTKP
jgi:hypothetical protein